MDVVDIVGPNGKGQVTKDEKCNEGEIDQRDLWYFSFPENVKDTTVDYDWIIFV